ncbi:family 20 glycosylhydrolase [Olivibacter sp. CPCC 100613]|uniref:family 20 glycosylhydrolase n=1 Tax=Olivibacter sp. CPCC 100613 TaxID=3079931 RepID=UPI002FF7D7CC
MNLKQHHLFSFFIIYFLFPLGAFSQGNVERFNLIPLPNKLERQAGIFEFPHTGLSYSCSDESLFQNELQYLQKKVLKQTLTKSKSKGTIQLLLDKSLSTEAYGMVVNKDGLVIKASTANGMFYGLQTLQQMLDLNPADRKQLPYLTIDDQPVYGWRGMELDVARHFFSKAYLLKLIDLLAYYKLNTLHLHLTDDQGWRLEIKRYPKLTEQGAWRHFNNQDSACMKQAVENPDFNLSKEHLRERNGEVEYGGFYTQEDMREIIAYAATRHVEIIPEIDMPGHMMVATRAYPELLDSTAAGWGKQFSVPICVGKEEAYTFVEGVLEEVIDLFPSRFIHIGADEVEKSSWERSPKCRELMAREGIKDMHALQSYFVNRVNNFIQSKGKTTIGWDEVLDGGADSSLRVMYWRGWVKDAPLKAVKGHHDLVMTPTNPLYFDYLPNKSTLESVYGLKVVGDDIPADLKHFVKGAQANLWTETIPSTDRLEFMMLPRLTALAERVWTTQADFDTYKQRILHHYSLWDAMQIKYRQPDLEGFADEQVIVDGHAELRVRNPLASTKVYYTTDGTVPDRKSRVLPSILKIKEATEVRFASISNGGAKSEQYLVRFKPAEWHKGLNVKGSDLKLGLKASFFDGTFKNTKEISGAVMDERVLKNVAISDTVKWPSFAAKIRGYIRVPEKARYNFYYTCDDGGILSIADQLVVDNDGQHAPIEKSGQIALDAGFHALAADFIEAGGGFTLKCYYSVDGGPVKPIPDDWLFY